MLQYMFKDVSPIGHFVQLEPSHLDIDMASPKQTKLITLAHTIQAPKLFK